MPADLLLPQVDYGLRNGTKVESVGWAARMVFAEGDELKMSRYQVRPPVLSFFPNTADLLFTQVWLVRLFFLFQLRQLRSFLLFPLDRAKFTYSSFLPQDGTPLSTALKQQAEGELVPRKTTTFCHLPHFACFRIHATATSSTL
jgi:hypothetical protein